MCLLCRGTGYLQTLAQCESTGDEVHPFVTPCIICKGAGKNKRRHVSHVSVNINPCSACTGLGIVHDEETQTLCNSCNGIGIVIKK